MSDAKCREVRTSRGRGAAIRIFRLAPASLALVASIGLASSAIAQASTSPVSPAIETTLGASTASGTNGAVDVKAPPPTVPSTDPKVAVDSLAPSIGSLPIDLSPWSMFLSADVIVKAVMVGLALASVVTWTVWLVKGLELALAKRRARSASRKLRHAKSLADATREVKSGWTRRGPVADLVEEATTETRLSEDLSADGVKERLAIELSRIEARAGRNMARGAGLLATIGATAPFVGLFGTVWGIMNAFIGISKSHTTNLAVVAPGIAEALLATAIGLIAAIPAVIIYNLFARSIAGYRAVLSDASGTILRHVSRDLERQERRQPNAEASPRNIECVLPRTTTLRPSE